MPVPVTIKLDEALKKAAEETARSNGQTLTAFVHGALRRQLRDICPTCGARTALPPGKTPEFERFFSRHARSPVYLTTVVNGKAATWKGRLWRMTDSSVSLAPMQEGQGSDAIFLREQVIHYEEGDNGRDAAAFEATHPSLPSVEPWGR